jgi:hypothetical protein
VEPAAGAGIAADANRALGSVAVAELMREFTLSRSLRRRPVSVPVLAPVLVAVILAVILGVARRRSASSASLGVLGVARRPSASSASPCLASGVAVPRPRRRRALPPLGVAGPSTPASPTPSPRR